MSMRVLVARLLALIVAVGAIALGWGSVPAHAAPVTVTGTVVDITDDAPIADADVEVYDEVVYEFTSTAPDGSYSFALEPGTYDIDVNAPGYAGKSVTFTVSEANTVVPPIKLQPVTELTGTVVDADTSAGIVGAEVDAYGPTGAFTTTSTGGAYSLSLEPGLYEIYAVAEGYEPGFLEYEVTPASTTIPPIELAPLVPGVTVSVTNSTFGSPAPNVTVSMQPAGGGATVQKTTDTEGQARFTGLANGDYVFQTQPGNGIIPGDPVTHTYTGGFSDVSLSVAADLRCEPASANSALTNMGFENDLDGWTLGFRTESITSVTADSFTSPWEGSRMARLGNSQPSAGQDQPEGPNIMCQDFKVTSAEERFAFNVFTYDYTGFDEFKFDVVVTDPASGETLAAYEQGAWGEGTELKTSGWRGVAVDLSGHVGDTVRISFRAGGTSDDLYAFWAYLDSAATMPPPVVTSSTSVNSTTGSVTTDPVTGQLTVAMPTGALSPITLTQAAGCQDPSVTPTSVDLILSGQNFPGTPAGNGLYTMTIPQTAVVSGFLSLQVVCPDETTKVVPLGQIVLYDPSGIITDGVTNAPIVGAEVVLHKVPGWTPQSGSGPHPATSCQTNQTKPAGTTWNQPAPTQLGQVVSPASPEIHPNVNPFITNSIGYYGWDVAEGCWYVVVSADGYKTLTSPVVGVPTEVTDLHLQLLPKAISNTAPPVITGTAKVGSTLSASPGSWNLPGTSHAYQWLRNGNPIPGATGSTYKLAAADVLAPVSVRVTASKDGHDSSSATSDPVTPPKMVAKVLLKKLPKSAKVGSLVKAAVVVKVPDGVATGKVAVTAGKKKLGAGSLKKGKATIALKKLKAFKAGKYKLVAKYAGSATTNKASSKKVGIKLVK